MIKMRIDGGKNIEIEACGTMPHIAVEILIAVKTLKDKMDKCEGMGEAFVEKLKHGLEFIDTLDNDECDDVDDMVNELVDKALEDDDFFEKIMGDLPDELKADFARRLKERARMGKTEMKTETEAEEK